MLLADLRSTDEQREKETTREPHPEKVPVSYTHLQLLELRAGLFVQVPGERLVACDIGRQEAQELAHGDGLEAVSYTHLDVYKRQQQATADGIRMVREAGADNAVLTLQAFEALKCAANGRATKLIIPSNIQGLAGLAASLKEIVVDDAEGAAPPAK